MRTETALGGTGVGASTGRAAMAAVGDTDWETGEPAQPAIITVAASRLADKANLSGGAKESKFNSTSGSRFGFRIRGRLRLGIDRLTDHGLHLTFSRNTTNTTRFNRRLDAGIFFEQVPEDPGKSFLAERLERT